MSALGAMSWIATNPSPRATWSPSCASRQKRQSSGSADPLLGHRRRRGREPAGRRARRRARASSRRRTRGRAGRRARCRRDRSWSPTARGRPRPRAPAAARCAPSSRARGTGSSAAVRVPGRGEYGKTCTFVSPAARTTSSVRSNARSSSAGKPTIASLVRLKSLEPLEPAQVRRGRVAPAHRPQDAVVARLERHVQMPRDRRRLAQRCDQLRVHVVDLDRREAQPLEARRRARLAHEARERRSPPRGRGSSRG